jgi:hypothetical protein
MLISVVSTTVAFMLTAFRARRVAPRLPRVHNFKRLERPMSASPQQPEANSVLNYVAVAKGSLPDAKMAAREEPEPPS